MGIFQAVLGVMLLAGLGISGYGIYLFSRSRSIGASGATATGVVVDNKMRSRRDDGVSFQPVVRYEVDGQEFTVVGSMPRNHSFLAGTTMQVRYDPADPSRADIGGTGAGLTYLVGGAVFAVFVLFMMGMVDSFPTM